jgi:hypothetical protein
MIRGRSWPISRSDLDAALLAGMKPQRLHVDHR